MTDPNAIKAVRGRGRSPFSVAKFVRTIVLAVFVLAMMFPFFWMLSTSFKLEKDVFTFPVEWIPPHFTWDNFKTVWTVVPELKLNFPLFYLNSIKVTLATVILQLIVSSMAAYAFSKMKFKASGVLFAIFLATMMIPEQVTLVPRFLLISRMGLIDTLTGLIVMGAFSVYGVFLLRQAMIAVPDSLIEAARIDGAGHLRIFFSIMLPLVKPTLATLAVLRFVWSWNDYQGPLIFLNSPEKFTLQLAMTYFSDVNGTLYALMMAAAVSAIVPLLIVFLFGQRYVIEGMSAGAVKG
jgi:multiple sugar transport system permease protein